MYNIKYTTFLFPEPNLFYPWVHLALRVALLCISCSSQNPGVILALSSPSATTFYQLSSAADYTFFISVVFIHLSISLTIL